MTESLPPSPNSAGIEPGPNGRREFLRRAAATTAAAGFAAPIIRSSTAMAASGGTCPCEATPLDLSASPFGVGTNVANGPFAANGTTMTFTPSNADTTTEFGPLLQTGVIEQFLFGGIPNFVYIPMYRRQNVGPANQDWTLTIAFSPAVWSLSFLVVDPDCSVAGRSRYREQVEFSWVGSATPSYVVGPDLESAGPNAFRPISTTFNTPDNSSDANIEVSFDCGGAISQLTIRSEDLNPEFSALPTQGARAIGIGNFSFCAP